MQIGFDWTQYSLARINLVAAGRGNCGNILPKSDDATIVRFRQALSGRLTQDDQALLSVYDCLKDCAPGTLGASMALYYRTQGHSPVEPSGTFPVRYIMIHDAHHVLINASTDDQGELNVLAFECGMIQRGQKAESLIPVLAQAKAFPDCDIPQMAQYWELGCNAKPGLLETFELGHWIDHPLSAVQSAFNLPIHPYA